MAETIYKELKTRIALKTLPLLGENSWDSIKDTYKPLKGEVCICEIPQGNANATTAPTILFKVGDGTSTWGQLKWASALAADVYDWAKKPQAEFITWVNTVVEHPAAPVITTGNENGTIAVDGTDVAVKGLGSAAYTNANAYATSAENGAKQAAADAQKTIDDYAVAHKDDYTNKQIDDAIAAVDTGVHAVDLTTGDANGQVKLTVDGESKNVEVKGLASAAYAAVESLNATAKGYADAVETGVENGTIIAAKATNADNAAEATHATNADNATNAVHAGSAVKVDNALTVKVGGAEVIFDGSAPKTADVDSAIKAAIDAIPEQTDYSVSIEEDTTDSTIAKRYIFKQLGEEIGRIDLAKELVVTSGSVKEVTTADEPYTGAKVGDKYIELVIANQTTPIYVPAKDLVDIYTYEKNATEVQVNIDNQNVVSATLVNGGVSTAKIADDAVTVNKLADAINTDIAKGVDAQGRVAVLEAKPGLEKVGTVTSVSAGDGLTGGPITDTGSLAHAVPTGAAAQTKGGDTANPMEVIDKVTTDKFGHITEITTKTLDTSRFVLKDFSITANEGLEGGGEINGTSVTIGIADKGVTSEKLAEAVNTDIAKGVTAHGWGNHADAGYAKTADLGELATKDTITTDLIDGFEGAVKAFKIPEAFKADDADTLGGKTADDFATSAQGYMAEEAVRAAGVGLKIVTPDPSEAEPIPCMEIDTDVVFVLNCNW